jgi:hypothetical protein
MLRIIFVMILCVLAGCGTTSDQRIEMLQSAVQQAESAAGQVDVYIAELQAAIAEAKLLLQDPALSFEQKEEVLKFLTETDAALTDAIAKKEEVLESLTDFKNAIAALEEQGADLSTELVIIGEGTRIAAESLPPPYNAIGLLVGTIATVIGTILGKRKGTESADKTIDGIVDSVNAALSKSVDASLMKATMKEVQAKAGVRDKVVASL